MTYHCMERAKERAGLNEAETIKLIDNAREKGKGAGKFHSKERTYLCNRSSDGKKAIVYNNYCFIFKDNGICITMYPVPDWFGKKQFYKKKKKIRNVKRYYKTLYIDDMAYYDKQIY